VADSLIPVATLGLVYLAPMYYLLILTGGIRPPDVYWPDVRQRTERFGQID
jgi:hypothetical protein